MSASSTRLVFITKDTITQLISINEYDTIKMRSTNKDKAIKRVSSDNGKVDEINIVDITNSKSVKINFQS